MGENSICGRVVPEITTLCYLERNHQHHPQYLMLHRTVKKNDVNHDKWIGVGGHVEAWESPEDCLLREVREETGLLLTSYRMRGVVTFLSGRGDYEYMFLYTADQWVQAEGTKTSRCAGDAGKEKEISCCAGNGGKETETSGCTDDGGKETKASSCAGDGGNAAVLPWCDEGVLEWVDIAKIEELNLWEGDKIFFRLIDRNAPFFSLKLVYDGKDHLEEAVLDGKTLCTT